MGGKLTMTELQAERLFLGQIESKIGRGACSWHSYANPRPVLMTSQIGFIDKLANGKGVSRETDNAGITQDGQARCLKLIGYR